jgi:hypothetical protein
LAEAANGEFDRGLDALRRFQAAHGHTRVPDEEVDPVGFRIGAWLASQRSLARAGLLPPDRVDALEALGVARVRRPT